MRTHRREDLRGEKGPYSVRMDTLVIVLRVGVGTNDREGGTGVKVWVGLALTVTNLLLLICLFWGVTNTRIGDLPLFHAPRNWR